MENRIRLSSGLITTFLFIISCISFFDFTIFEVLQEYFKYVFMISMVVIFILECRKLPRKQAMIFAVIMTCFLFVSIKNKLSMGSYFTIVSGISAIYCYSLVELNKIEQRICNLFAVVLYFYIILISVRHYGNWLSNEGVEKIINPNTYSFILVYLTVFLSYSISSGIQRNKPKKILMRLLYTFSTIAVFFLKSRGALLGIIFCVFLQSKFIRRKFEKAENKLKVNEILMLAFYIGGAALPLIYCKVVNHLIENGVYLVIRGKDIYTRYYVWNLLIEELSSKATYILFGLSNLENFEALQYVHNNSLSIIGYTGIVGFILYYMLLRKSVVNVIDTLDIDNILYYAGFTSVFVIGLTESSTFWAVLYGFEFMLLCGRSKKEKYNST